MKIIKYPNKAGREMDEAIAAKIFGVPYSQSFLCPRYSTVLADAWQVVDAFDRPAEDECNWEIFTVSNRVYNGEKVWTAGIESQNCLSVVMADTAPLAICKAALRFIEKFPDWLERRKPAAHA